MNSGSKFSNSTIYLFLLFIVLINISVFSQIASGQELQLYIDAEIEVYEGDQINISACSLDEYEIYTCHDDVQITFNKIFTDGPYEIVTGEEQLTLIAPEITEDVDVTITATKTGYLSGTTIITIKNKVEDQIEHQLFIDPDSFTIDAGKRFSVIVVDENDNPVSEVLIGIESPSNEKDTTDDAGRGFLKAPEEWDSDEFSIYAQKDGYTDGKIEIALNFEKSWLEELLENSLFPVFIGGFVLFLAIIFVYFRQKRSINKRAKQISKDKLIRKYEVDPKNDNNSKEEILYSSSIKEGVRVAPKSDSKVEEIRISRPKKDKDIVSVSEEKDETDKVISKKQRETRDISWFEGTDEIKYEIDKLTGEIDEEGIDKWYEGVDSLKEKIDEKVKKKDKKKDEDDDEEEFLG